MVGPAFLDRGLSEVSVQQQDLADTYKRGGLHVTAVVSSLKPPRARETRMS